MLPVNEASVTHVWLARGNATWRTTAGPDAKTIRVLGTQWWRTRYT